MEQNYHCAKALVLTSIEHENKLNIKLVEKSSRNPREVAYDL